MQVFIAISLILGDGLYNLIKIISITVKEMWNSSTKQNNLPIIKEVLGKKICGPSIFSENVSLCISLGTFPLTRKKYLSYIVIFCPLYFGLSLLCLFLFLGFALVLQLWVWLCKQWCSAALKCCALDFLLFLSPLWIITFKNLIKFMRYSVNMDQGVILENGSWIVCMIMWF